MGMPGKRAAYELSNDKVVDSLFYRTGGWSPSSMTDTDDQFASVASENNRVIEWRRHYDDRVVRAAVDVMVKLRHVFGRTRAVTES